MQILWLLVDGDCLLVLPMAVSASPGATADCLPPAHHTHISCHRYHQGKNGATTVSATMMLAAAAGIRIFVTGGIGGVHRGGEVSMDVSADLTELGRTPVTVVCAGVKTILDIPRTLEYLETQASTTVTIFWYISRKATESFRKG